MCDSDKVFYSLQNTQPSLSFGTHNNLLKQVGLPTPTHPTCKSVAGGQKHWELRSPSVKKAEHQRIDAF